MNQRASMRRHLRAADTGYVKDQCDPGAKVETYTDLACHTPEVTNSVLSKVNLTLSAEGRRTQCIGWNDAQRCAPRAVHRTA